MTEFADGSRTFRSHVTSTPATFHFSVVTVPRPGSGLLVSTDAQGHAFRTERLSWP